MANRINFQIGYTVDKAGLSEMQSLFQRIANLAKEPGNELKTGLQQAAATANTLDGILEKKCKKMCIPGEDTNMEELQEIIKPFYLRRLKSDFAEMTTKTIKCIHYEMTNDEKKSYNELWKEYLELQEDKANETAE